MDNKGKVIGIRGASGFLGGELSSALIQNGYKVVDIRRNFIFDDIRPCDVVINLAGRSINCRWTKKNRREIYDSRIGTTRSLVNAIKGCGDDAPTLLISTSATGIYPSSDGSVGTCPVYNEDSLERGNGFLSNVCSLWEGAAMEATGVCRVAVIRLGVVISKNGGAFPKLAFPFRMRVAARIATGMQPFSWISLEDVIGSITHIIENESLEGVFNLTSPELTTNREITSILAIHYRTLFPVVVPKFLLNLVYGKAHTLLTEGAHVYPKRLPESGYKFKRVSFREFLL